MVKLPRPALFASAIAIALIAAAAAFLSQAPERASALTERGKTEGPQPPPSFPIASPPTKDGRRTAAALVPAGDGSACTADRACCVVVREGEDGLARPLVLPAGHADAPVAQSPGDEAGIAWPMLVVLGEGGFLAGVETQASTSYSGGGGSATELRLFRITKDGTAEDHPVLTLPVQASLLIRACFSEDDVKARSDACHDEYGFTAVVSVQPSTGRLPVVDYSTEAGAFPRGASRNEDSTTRPPLTSADLVREKDEVCSFRRRFEFSPTTNRYEPVAPLPECSAYTVP